MSLRRSARQSSTLLATTNGTSSSVPSARSKRENGEDDPPQTQPKRVKKGPPPKVSAAESATFKVPPVPVTPVRNRSAKAVQPPQLTPTPSLVGLMRMPDSSGDIDATPPPNDRPVEPHTTNATLTTPGGTQVTAYSSSGWPDSSPSKTGLPKPTGTTGTILDQACAHLISVDPKMKPLVEKHRCEIFSAKGLAEKVDPFRSLTTGIIGQQVSGAAANSIKNKFIALFNEAIPDKPVFPTPAQVANTDIARLRLAGLSQRKAEYIQGLAEKFASGELSTAMLMKASDEEVMEKLIAVRGLGRWSVEMFACFGLKRMDVFSTGDLGVQRGMAAFMGKDVSKLRAKGGGKWKYMSENDMLEHSARFAPYRSLFMWYMWRVEDVDVSVMQNGE